MKSFFKKYSAKIDIFGQPITLKLNSENSSKTILGGIITFWLIVILISIFVILFLEIYNRTKPSISIENKNAFPRPNILLNNETLNFAFGLTNDGTGVVDNPRYFTFKADAYFNTNTADGVLIQTSLPTRICIPSDFPQLRPDHFVDLTLNYMYCVDNINIPIFGYYDEPTIQYITASIHYCKNETENSNCASMEEIQDFLKAQPYFFNIYLLNSVIDSQNFKNPISYNILNLYKGLMTDKSKFSEIYLKYETLESDDGLIVESINKYSTISFDYQEPDDTDVTNQIRLMAFYLMPSNNIITHHRIYKKIPDMLGLLGGLSNVMIFTLNLCCYIFTTFKRDEKILNKIFDYDMKKIEAFKERKQSIKIENIKNTNNVNSNVNNFAKFIEKEQEQTENTANFLNLNLKKNQQNSNSNSNLRLKEIQNIKDNSNQIFSSNINLIKKFKFRITASNKESNIEKKVLFKVDTKKDYNLEIKEILQNMIKNYQINFSYSQILMMYICKCFTSKSLKHKILLIDKSYGYLNEILDISNLAQKLEEFEKLKFILLSNEQVALFSFIAKEIISNDNNRRNTITELKEFTNNKEELANIVINHLKTLNRGNELNDIDKKLLELLHPEIKTNFYN